MTQSNEIHDFYSVATKYVAIAAIFVILPFAVNNFLQDRLFLGFMSMAVISILGFNALFIVWGRYIALLTFCIQVPIIVFFLSVSFLEQGIIGALWSPPALLSFYIMLPERLAWLANFILLIVVAILSWTQLDNAIAMRVVATLTAASIFSGVFMRIITLQQNKLRKLAVTDPLTGLKNRMLLTETLEQAIYFNRRNGEPMTLLAIDLDHFKRINDTFGHEAGDKVLVNVATLLSARMRHSDKIFRIGGEEFLCLLYGSDKQNSKQIAEQIRIEVSTSCGLPDMPVTISLGVASLNAGEDSRTWMKRADDNLYAAKGNGRNRIVAL